jgi:hypothetical protein
VRTNVRVAPLIMAGAVGLQIYDAYLVREWAPFFLAGAAIFIGLGIWGTITLKRRLERIDSLRRQLAERSGSLDQGN